MLSTVLRNQNSSKEEIKSRSNSRIACYCSVHNPAFSHMLHKKVMLKPHKL
jgi:hypothetical protein